MPLTGQAEIGGHKVYVGCNGGKLFGALRSQVQHTLGQGTV